MAYDTETFQVLHRLTKSGEIEYRRILEEEADRILFRHQHPFRYFLQKISDLMPF